MNKQNVLIAGVVLALVLGLVGIFRSGGTGPVGPQGPDGQTIGSSVGPDSYFPCESHNGVTSCFNKVSLQQATTTICSIKSPSATSTLDFAAIHINVATTGGATTLTFSQAVFGASASTTRINGSNLSVGSGAESNALASSTIFAPNTMFNVTQAGGGAFAGGTFSEGGWCQATFNTLVN